MRPRSTGSAIYLLVAKQEGVLLRVKREIRINLGMNMTEKFGNKEKKKSSKKAREKTKVNAK